MLVLERHLVQPAGTLLESPVADVPRDREEPGARVERCRAVCERATGIQECLLDSVFGLVTVAEHGVRHRVGVLTVQAVELLERLPDRRARRIVGD